MIKGHGDDRYQYTQEIRSDFSSNVCGCIRRGHLQERLLEGLKQIGSYPEPEPLSLERAFAALLHLEPEGVCVTNGATEAIYLTAQAFRGKRSAIWNPTFSEYEDACRMHGHRLLPFYALEALPAEAEVVWICNPNNPTGEVRDRKVLASLFERYPEKIFVIDQSYEMYTLQRLFSAKEAAEFPNVLLLHSLTKHYAIPGLRLGYATGNPLLLRELRAQRMPWSVNCMAIQAGFYAVEERLQPTLDVVAYLQEKAWLEEALKKTGAMEVWHSDTHFMLVRLRYGKASALKEYLVNEWGILIRDASNFDGLDEHFFRIATQSHEENVQLVKAIESWLVL